MTFNGKNMFTMSVIFLLTIERARIALYYHCSDIASNDLSLGHTMQFSHCAEGKQVQVKTRTSSFNTVLFVAAALGNDVSFKKIIKSYVCRGEKIG